MTTLIGRIQGLRLEVRGVDLADSTSTINSVSLSVQRERPSLRGRTAPDGTVTIMFSDIEGSTAMTDRLGDVRWMQVLAAHNDIICREVDRVKGFIVKSAGDGYMIAFPSRPRPRGRGRDPARPRGLQRRGTPTCRSRCGSGSTRARRSSRRTTSSGATSMVAARIGAAAAGGEVLVSSRAEGADRGSTAASCSASHASWSSRACAAPTSRIRWTGRATPSTSATGAIRTACTNAQMMCMLCTHAAA